MPLDLIAYYYETMGFTDSEGVLRTYDGPEGLQWLAGIVVMPVVGPLQGC